ncbi:uncharacterized protein BCR38DRAFT_480964 [Pseudomassariella vexata]|uniref:Uncharacterized protein n=1 Tax=Pseudomassariella vexata TaxID=1141098 RepID=A0A1Y2EEU7_9PEZI|nr:uncharacterized protein BCR38DRAFT_480964 [Pseudomassariella vexata]ORY69796.1 hypothetical protein BCR38DRAFT_480964 [Pseudomassariella vexata]
MPMLAQPLEVPLEVVRGLQELEIEFEMVVRKKEQLDLVLERARYWVFPLAGTEAVLRPEKGGKLVEEFEWEGPATLTHDNMPILKQTGQMGRTDGKKRTYHVAVMRWARVSPGSQERSLAL